jgi:putative ABC transport system substrate-binding protein
LTLRAQQKAMPVIGYLSSFSPLNPFVAAFRQGLSEVGYVEGQNLTIEYRWAENRYERLPALAADLVGRKVDAIAASGGDLSSRAAKSATSTIPIVSIIGGDPVAAGLVASLARPGGNLTGVSFLDVELTPKRFELLSELVPQASVIALLENPSDPNAERIMRDAQDAARIKGVQLLILKPAPKARSTPPSQPSSNGALARSSSVPIRSSSAGASSSWRWHHTRPCRRSIRSGISSLPEA